MYDGELTARTKGCNRAKRPRVSWHDSCALPQQAVTNVTRKGHRCGRSKRRRTAGRRPNVGGPAAPRAADCPPSPTPPRAERTAHRKQKTEMRRLAGAGKTSFNMAS